MIIELNKDYAITSDKYQFILNKIIVRGEDSKNAGEKYYSPISYHPRIEHLIKKLLLTEVMEDDTITEFKQIAETIARRAEEISDNIKKLLEDTTE